MEQHDSPTPSGGASPPSPYDVPLPPTPPVPVDDQPVQVQPVFYGPPPPGSHGPPPPGFYSPPPPGFHSPPPPGFHGPPPPGYFVAPPAAQWNGKTNGLSIAALVTALLGCMAGVVGLVLGIAGIVQSRRNGDVRGRNLGIAAVAVAGLYLVAIVGVAGVLIHRDVTNPERDDTGALNGPRSVYVTDLRLGDCIEDLDTQGGPEIGAVPCSLMHTSEVVGVFRVPPGATDRDAAVEAGCEDRFEEYAGVPVPEDAEVGTQLYWVEVEDADPTGPDVICFAHEEDRSVMGSIRNR